MSYYHNYSVKDFFEALQSQGQTVPFGIPMHNSETDLGAYAGILSREAGVSPSYFMVTNYNVGADTYRKNPSVKTSMKYADTYALLVGRLIASGMEIPQEMLDYMENMSIEVNVIENALMLPFDNRDELDSAISELDSGEELDYEELSRELRHVCVQRHTVQP